MPRESRSSNGASPLGSAVQIIASPLGQLALLLAAVLCLSVGLAWWWYDARGTSAGPTGPTVRIATWNLREFSPNRRGTDLGAIAGIIHDNHFDVLALQEIKRDGEEVDRLVQTLGGPWRAAQYSDTTGNHERFAFIYDASHVRETGVPHVIATADAVIFDRVPYQDTFTAGAFTFTLVEVHLSYTNVQRRATEAAALVRYAERLEQNDPVMHVIVCGDFNEEPPHGNIHLFTDQGWQSLNHDPTNLGGSEVFDTFLIDPVRTHAWTGLAASVHFETTLYDGDRRAAEEAVSDHRPAYADFVTTAVGD